MDGMTAPTANNEDARHLSVWNDRRRVRSAARAIGRRAGVSLLTLTPYDPLREECSAIACASACAAYFASVGHLAMATLLHPLGAQFAQAFMPGCAEALGAAVGANAR